VPTEDLADIVEGDRLVANIAVAPVLTLSGQKALLRDFWRRSVTVTSFVRHFGCLFCHQMVHDLVKAVPDILRRGARVIVVGNGSINQARHFFQERNLPAEGVEVLTDPERNSYQAAAFERGYGETFFNRGSQRAFARARADGHRITGLFGDLTQLGGVLVVRPPVKLLYIHRSRFAGDHPDMADVLAVLDNAGV
jgi:hypothetical protein